MTVIVIPKILREKLSDEGAEAFVQILDRVEERTQKVVLEIAEERFEKRLMQIESKIESRATQTETRLIRWMFGFIIGQFWAIIGAMLGILFAFFRK